MIVGRRGPDLTKSAFGNEVLIAHGVPKRAADCARVRSTVENGSNYFHLAGPSITVFPEVSVEAQRLVVASFTQTLLLQKVNRKNCCVCAVSTAKSEGTIF